MSCLKILAHIWLLINIVPKLVNSSGEVVDFCYYNQITTQVQ